MIESLQRLSLASTQFFSQISSSDYSQTLKECPNFAKLDSIVITNFKSFRDTVYIGPFLDCTSIIGPNGSGKSNILDAIMFCFCNQKNKGQYYDIRDYIQRDGKESYSQMIESGKYCEVIANLILQNGRSLALKRRIYPNEDQTFSIDGDEYEERVYQNFLIKNNINYIVCNYAIWQGQIDKFLMKNPREMTAYIQAVSGSIFFRRSQEQITAQFNQNEQKMESIAANILKLKQQKKTIRTLNSSKQAHTQFRNQYEKLLKQIMIVKLHLSKKQIGFLQNQKKKVQQAQHKKVMAINSKKVDMIREKAQKTQIHNLIEKLLEKIGQNKTNLKIIEQNSSVIDLQTIKTLKMQLESLNQYMESLRNKQTNLQKEIHQTQSTQIQKQYLEVYSRWEMQNQAINKELSKKKQQYLYVQGIIQAKQTTLQQFKQKQQKLQKLKQNSSHLVKKTEDDLKEIEKTISTVIIQKARIQALNQNNRTLIKQLTLDYTNKSDKILQLQNLLSQNIENNKQKELVQKLSSIQGFRGILQQWVKPSAKKYEVCFDIMMGAVNKYLLCADQTSAKQLALKLRELVQMRSVVILENVIQRKQSLSISAIGKLGTLAIEIVDFDKSINKLDIFLKDILSGKVICSDIDAGWQLYQHKVKGVKQIYTLDGSVIKADGSVSSFGAVDSVKKKYKYLNTDKNRSTVLKDLKQLQKQRESIQQKIQSQKIKLNQDQLSKIISQKNRLEIKKQELTLQLKRIKNEVENKKHIKIPQGLQRDLGQLKSRSLAIQTIIKNIEKQMTNSRIFDQFLKKHNINSLDSFRSIQNVQSLQAAMKLKNKISKQLKQIQKQLEKTQINRQKKHEKLTKLQEKLQKVQGIQNKNQIISEIKNQETSLAQLRSKLTKIQNLGQKQQLKFRSELPQFEAKISLLKDHHERMIRQESANLGLSGVPGQQFARQAEQDLRIRFDQISDKRLSQINDQLLEKKKELQKQIQNFNLTASNFNFSRQNEAQVNQQLQQLSRQLKKRAQQKKQHEEKLEEVKVNRKNVFTNFLQLLKPILQQAYAILTQQEGKTPGKVSFFVENQSMPFEEGLYYNPTPPNKRFIYDLDQLSGGQKSIASLALQYAVAIVSKSPFLMLDQFDAFLDVSNVKRFVNLLTRQWPQRKLQFILITHKSSLFLKGDSLVGVCKPKNNPFSKVFSLRLDEDADNDNDHQ